MERNRRNIKQNIIQSIINYVSILDQSQIAELSAVITQMLKD